MSSFLCFICHSTVNSDTKEEIRDKYREVIGMSMCPNSHMCRICCHVLNKLFLFKSVCLKRSMEYPVLFSEKGTLNLQRNDIELQTICAEDTCAYHHNRNINSKTYHLMYQQTDKHVKFDDERNDFDEYFNASHEEQNLHELMHMEDVAQVNDTNKYFDPHENIDNNCIDDFNYDDNVGILPVKSPNDAFKTTKKDYVTNFDHLKINSSKFDLNVNEKVFNANFSELEINNQQINVNATKYNDNLAVYNYNIAPDAFVSNTNLCNQNTADLDLNSQNIVHSSNTKPNINNPDNIQENFSKTNESLTLNIEENEIQELSLNQNIPQTIPEAVVEITNLDEEVDKIEESCILDINLTNVEENDTTTETNDEKKQSKRNKHKSKKKLKKVVLTIEQQKMELESKRKEKKYLEAEFKCYNCAIGFLFKDTYQAHMMRHEESNGEHVCEVCSLRFARAYVLRSHLARHARPTRVASDTRAARPRHAHASTSTLSSSGIQKSHRVRRAGTSRTYSCNTCGETYSNQAAVRSHMIKHINRKFNCDQCSATFSSPYTLNQHKKKHIAQDVQLFYCTTCKTSYNTRKNLLAHWRNSLRHQQTIYECPVCTRTCSNQRSLKLHIESVHSNSLNYACDLCPSRYSNRKSLLRHARSHTGDAVVNISVCHICGARFKGNNKLNRHLREVCQKAKLEEELANFYDEE